MAPPATGAGRGREDGNAHFTVFPCPADLTRFAWPARAHHAARPRVSCAGRTSSGARLPS
ncbi:hypothetical protein DIE03_09000 [Burkholderia sp. Bp8992]|nr:hypothetical protein DIE03_09000 [Burkholderia sp. Bp8992]